MRIILAPHVDDEVIGCFKLLKEKQIDKVIYFFEVNPIRKNEALIMAKHFGVKVSFEGFRFKPKEGDIIYIPCKQDTHEHHRQVNLMYRFYKNVYFYSTDKNFRQLPLTVEDRICKKNILDALYPTQKNLWENDAKYYLFETILETDDIVYVYCKEQFEGYHYWKGAKNFLKHPHRHIFHVRLQMEVFHQDREVEFIKLKNELKAFLDKNYTMKKFEKSCEMIGSEIKKHFESIYKRTILVEVSEDNENGAVIF